VHPTIDLNPSSSPSSYPTVQLSTPYEVIVIDGEAGGNYTTPAEVTQFVIDTTANVVLRGGDGRNKYTIIPHAHSNITITNFKTRQDILDFSRFPGIVDQSAVGYSTFPLIFSLYNGQTIKLPDHPQNDLDEPNFIFSTQSLETGSGGTSSGDGLGTIFTPEVIVSVAVFGGLFLLTILMYKMRRNILLFLLKRKRAKEFQQRASGLLQDRHRVRPIKQNLLGLEEKQDETAEDLTEDLRGSFRGRRPRLDSNISTPAAAAAMLLDHSVFEGIEDDDSDDLLSDASDWELNSDLSSNDYTNEDDQVDSHHNDDNRDDDEDEDKVDETSRDDVYPIPSDPVVSLEEANHLHAAPWQFPLPNHFHHKPIYPTLPHMSYQYPAQGDVDNQHDQ
jgi:hypothetical protein